MDQCEPVEDRIDIGPSVGAGWVIIAGVLALFAVSVWQFGVTPSHLAVLAVFALTPGPKLPRETYLERGQLYVGTQYYDVTACDYRLTGIDNIEVRDGGRVVCTIYKLGRGYRDAALYLSKHGALDPAMEEKLTWRPSGM